MKKLKYVGFYSDEKENRNYVLSAKNKMNYIAESIDGKIEIISPSWTYDNICYKGRIIKREKVNVILAPTTAWGNKINKIVSIIFSYGWLLYYLLKHIKKNENIVVYHSLWLFFPIYIVKKIKNFNLILEVEEIYSDVLQKSYMIKKIEQKLFDIADMYIFSTELLNEKLNKKNKPHVVIYGTYKVEEEITSKFTDGKIHLVYAGTLDCRKGGAQVAISTGEYLNEKFHIHILGFGDEKEKKEVKKLVEETQKKTNCQITYEGVLFGADYIKFIQKCHLGLSTQVSIGEYNDSSFPSKILSYMSNGLRVLSTKIKVLEVSKINILLYFYDSHNPKDIADEILKINFNDNYNGQMEIEFLDREFKKNINKILGLKNG